MNKRHFVTLALAGWLHVSSGFAATLVQDFSSDPFQAGWKATGNASLFHWDEQRQHLEVTWNSSEPNSYFHHPIGTIVTRDDDFSFAFDLRLSDIGPANEFVWSFQLAVGLLNIDQATQPGFLRGSGFESPNIVEVAYFREDEFGTPATVFPTFISTNVQFNFNPGELNSTNHALSLDVWHRISLTYTASTRTSLLVISNQATSDVVELTVPLNETFGDFRVGTLSISSYNDAGQFPGFEGSILAHGAIDNIVAVVPPPPVQELDAIVNDGAPGVTFLSRSGFVYTLERTEDFSNWTDASQPAAGTGEIISLTDDEPADGHAFYRVRAERP